MQFYSLLCVLIFSNLSAEIDSILLWCLFIPKDLVFLSFFSFSFFSSPLSLVLFLAFLAFSHFLTKSHYQLNPLLYLSHPFTKDITISHYLFNTSLTPYLSLLSCHWPRPIYSPCLSANGIMYTPFNPLTYFNWEKRMINREREMRARAQGEKEERARERLGEVVQCTVAGSYK